jgi:two-component sensor histidine kinase
MRILLITVILTLAGCFAIIPRAVSQVSSMNAKTIAEFEKLIRHYRYFKQDSAIYFVEKGLFLARSNGDSIGVAAMMLQMGMINDNLGEFDQSILNYRQALSIYEKNNAKKEIATALIRIGVVELRNGKYDVSIENFYKALQTAEQSGNSFGVMEANYSISWAYLDQKNYSSALRYLKIAERQNDSLPFSNISLNIFNHLGVVYRETGKYKLAEQYLEKGVRLSNKPEYMGLNITLINNLAAVYAKQGLIEKAASLQLDALQRSREMKNYLRELQALYGLSRTYVKNNPQKSISYLVQAIALARHKGAYNQEIRYLKAITPLYTSQQKYKEAFLAKEREKLLADSFQYTIVNKNIEALRSEYELSKSNARIKELNLLNNEKKLQLENADLVKNVTIAGSLLLLIILILLYSRYRIKQKKNDEISQKNILLQQLVEEKEWLLKEVHHRVKNNLHTIMSLLETQTVYLRDDALWALQNSQHRVYAMSLIHQKLYLTDRTTKINMKVYFGDLISYLRESFDLTPNIRFRVNLEDIDLDIAQAIPLGLILNEAVTNAVKYAFPDNRPGEVQISFIQNNPDEMLLWIADDGIGIPDSRLNSSNTLGLKLMKGLCGDIPAEFKITNNKGTRITITFSEKNGRSFIQHETFQIHRLTNNEEENFNSRRPVH